MARRPTIADLARVAEVSVATVDRVLNARYPVREETARRVYEAANSIGYHAASLIKHRLQESLPEYRLGFLLQRPEQAFYQAFAKEAAVAVAAAQQFRGTAKIEFLKSQAPGDVADHLREMGSRARAVAMVAVDHPTITTAVAELKVKGVPVFSLLSDFAPGVREGYVGVNNRKAGRTAAWMIATAAAGPGKVAMFVGSHRFHGQEMREIGLRSYFREAAPGFEVLDAMVNLEEPALAREVTLQMIDRHADLAGLYVAGGGMEGVIAALRQRNMAGRLAAVCNELTVETRAALADNVMTLVIATPLAAVCRELVLLMARAIESGGADLPGQAFLPFDLYVAENI
jgi:LacI family transcriptional regulator